jgi:hypothetical protein
LGQDEERERTGREREKKGGGHADTHDADDGPTTRLHDFTTSVRYGTDLTHKALLCTSLTP